MVEQQPLKLITSESNPMAVDFIDDNLVKKLYGENAGRIGLSYAPGRHQTVNNEKWERNIDTDLTSLKNDFKIDAILTVLQDQEIEEINIKDISNKCQQQSIVWRQYSVANKQAPENKEDSQKITTELNEMIKQGKTVFVHCKAGLGRAGTLAALLLKGVGGIDGDTSISEVRKARPGTIETESQVQFIKDY